MADETNPPSSPDTPKKETVRITLPPKPAVTPMTKRETVRINAPGATPKPETAAPAGGAPPAAPAPPSAPKKETARIQVPPAAGPRPGAPQGTVRLQPPTQPLGQPPPARPATLAPATAAVTEPAEADPLVGVLSWIVLLAALAAAGLGYYTFSTFTQ